MKYANDTQNYGDIIELPHHVSDNHNKMPISQRAAQFAPFAALSGYDDAIEETARYTDVCPILSEDARDIIDYKLHIISQCSENEPNVLITYFIPDDKKEGGRYESVFGAVKKIDEIGKCIIMENKAEIPMENIIDISGDMFDYLDLGL